MVATTARIARTGITTIMGTITTVCMDIATATRTATAIATATETACVATATTVAVTTTAGFNRSRRSQHKAPRAPKARRR